MPLETFEGLTFLFNLSKINVRQSLKGHKIMFYIRRGCNKIAHKYELI